MRLVTSLAVLVVLLGFVIVSGCERDQNPVQLTLNAPDESDLAAKSTTPDVLDFENMPPGTIVYTMYSAGGLGPIAVWADVPGGGGINRAVVFDSDNPTGGDWDLGTPNEYCDPPGPGQGEAGQPDGENPNCEFLHHLLIASERTYDQNGDGLVDNPDDADVVGTWISFDFSQIGAGSVAITSMTYLDVEREEPAPVIDFYDPNGNLITTVVLETTGDNGKKVKELGVPGVAFMKFTINGSGAIDDIIFVPEEECNSVLGNFVWYDLDANGLQNDEPGIPDVVVNLFDPDDLTTPIATSTTDADGLYLFSELCEGDYVIMVDESTLPDGWVESLCNVGMNDLIDNDCSPVTVFLPANTVDLSWDFGYKEEIPCAECEGKVTVLTLKYLGTETALIRVEANGEVIFEDNVAGGGQFTVYGNDEHGTLGTEIKVYTNGGNETKIHTSCSQPIGPGLVVGDFEVISGESRFGGPLCPLQTCDFGKPCLLTFTYTGEDCAASDHHQEAGKWSCDGDPMFTDPVFIRATDKSDPDDAGGKIYFEGLVALNGQFDAEAANADEDKFRSNTWFHIFNESGDWLQSIKIHTSCSAPLRLGDQFGSLVLDVFVPEGQCEEPGEPDGDLCDLGKPCLLTMEYTGEDCDETTNYQEGKVRCEGDPMFTDPVFIRATDKSSPYDTSGKIWFSGVVALNGMFDIEAANGGEDKLKSDTYVYIFTADGNTLLQSVKFHTSCSKELHLDDQFGSLILRGFIPEGQCEPPGGGDDECDGGLKPCALGMRYTGEDCTASNHGQDAGKVVCSGDPMFTDPVYIRVGEKDNPWDFGGKIFFEGTVALNGMFDIEAALGGETELKADTRVHIYTSDGSQWLQSIKFHTSCSQPLRIGDQFGSLVLETFVPKGQCDVPEGGDSCLLGNPCLLTMEYTGEDCTASNHAQDAGKVVCSGDPVFTDPVYIRVGEKDNPWDFGGKIFFQGTVALNGLFDIEAALGGEDVLKADTRVHVYTSDGSQWLQSIKFHTSCSQPLRVGDQFGSLILRVFVPRGQCQ